MKEKYTELEAEVISFTPSDIITTNTGGGSSGGSDTRMPRF